jgi:hypothetical protein
MLGLGGWGELDHRRDVEGDPEPAGSGLARFGVARRADPLGRSPDLARRRPSASYPVPVIPRAGAAGSARSRWCAARIRSRCSRPSACARRCGSASFEFEETYTLSDQLPDGTRLSLRVIAKNTLPLFGGELDRFDVRRLSTDSVDQTLDLLQRWCETATPH